LGGGKKKTKAKGARKANGFPPKGDQDSGGPNVAGRGQECQPGGFWKIRLDTGPPSPGDRVGRRSNFFRVVPPHAYWILPNFLASRRFRNQGFKR